MRYLLDTHSLSRDVLRLAEKRQDGFFVLRDVMDELPQTPEERRRIISSNIKILESKSAHIKKLAEVMAEYGDNLRLIGLYSGEGTADVLMLAYILTEREVEKEQLFPSEWVIVTEDGELTKVAQKNKIKTISKMELIRTSKR